MWEFNLNNLLGNISLNIIKICILDLTINLLLPHVVFTGVTTHSFEFTNSSSVKLLHTNSPICDFEISTQKFKTATMVDWMKQLYFMIGSVVYKRSPVLAPKVYEKSPDLCIEHYPLECAKMCSTVCIYMCLRSIKTLDQMVERKSQICNLRKSQLVKLCISISRDKWNLSAHQLFLISGVFNFAELHLSCLTKYF